MEARGEVGDADPVQAIDEAYDRMVWTAHHWQHWLDHGQFPDHPWRTALQRSALTLKGLTYAPTGAVIAAATTSLPETPGGERNWDYRYTWLRDAALTIEVAIAHGFPAADASIAAVDDTLLWRIYSRNMLVEFVQQH